MGWSRKPRRNKDFLKKGRGQAGSRGGSLKRGAMNYDLIHQILR